MVFAKSSIHSARRWVVAGLVFLGALSFQNPAADASDAGVPGKQPLHVFCGVGDNLWANDREPVDSPAAVDAMFDWMSNTYGIKRMYWRALYPWMPEEMKAGKTELLTYDWAVNWMPYLYNEQQVEKAAIASAKRHGMEIFYYAGLFEFGVQPDVGIIAPHQFEDRLRIEHPEWCMLDRWGERRAPGPISFAYPEARKAIIDKLVNHLVEAGYDGVNYYTYIENLGIRYLDEFGFNQPIIDAFNEKYPDVDLRKDTLTDEQKTYWYDCRGEFVTQFLRELHERLAPENKKLSMILAAENPDYAQPWWGHEIPGAGMIRMDWQRWIEEGIVDEIWVQLADPAQQEKLLDRLLEVCRGKPVKLTLRTPFPFDKRWAKYVDAGVTPVAVITWAKNGIERVSLAPTSLDALRSDDWRVRVQTLDDIANGKIKAAGDQIAFMADDVHLLARRKLTYALVALNAVDQVEILEKLLTDPESSVRIAAANALKKIHRPESAGRIIKALESDPHFQFKYVCVYALGAMGDQALPIVEKNLHHSQAAIREVCARAAFLIGRNGDADHVFDLLLPMMLDADETWEVRCHALQGATRLHPKISSDRYTKLLDGLWSLVESEPDATVQLYAVQGLSTVHSLMNDAARTRTLSILTDLFRKYGDNCQREDAAYGWRAVGNAIVTLGGNARLEAMRAQTQDKWLAWAAYEVMYVVQKPNAGKFNLVDEKQAIEDHDRFAPAFPGWRTW